jgi:hypothetical protein
MFRRIAVIQKPNPLELAQVIRRTLKRQLETPCEKTDAHVHVWNFILVSHDLNIDYLFKKNKKVLCFLAEKAPKTYKWRPLLRRGGLSRHGTVA